MQQDVLNRQYKVWFVLAFLSLILAGILGATMRLAFVIEMPQWYNYKYILHTHSHIAMMGWIFGGLYLFIIHYFKLNRRIYKNIFWLVQLSVIGMFISFPIQGYGLFSIFFTTLHLFLSYIFVYNIFKDLNDDAQNSLSVYSTLFLKTSGLLLVISTIGTWALGVIMNTSFKGSALYYASIQFFLHFQFNGWFTFALIAIFLKICSQYIYLENVKELSYSYWFLLSSCILTYALSVSWSTPENIIFWINSFGVMLQAVALFYIIKSVSKLWERVKVNLTNWTVLLFKIAFVGLILKILIQTLVAIPYLATISYTIKNFVIGFIHLLMLGSLSTFLIGNFEQYTPKGNQKIGLWFFLAGFLLSEVLLFIQGLMLWRGAGFIPNYYTLILLTSLLMPIGFVIYIVIKLKQLRTSDY